MDETIASLRTTAEEAARAAGAVLKASSVVR